MVHGLSYELVVHGIIPRPLCARLSPIRTVQQRTSSRLSLRVWLEPSGGAPLRVVYALMLEPYSSDCVFMAFLSLKPRPASLSSAPPCPCLRSPLYLAHLCSVSLHCAGRPLLDQDQPVRSRGARAPFQAVVRAGCARIPVGGEAQGEAGGAAGGAGRPAGRRLGRRRRARARARSPRRRGREDPPGGEHTQVGHPPPVRRQGACRAGAPGGVA